MVTFSCFRMATFRPATRKYAIFHALRFRLMFVISLPVAKQKFVKITICLKCRVFVFYFRHAKMLLDIFTNFQAPPHAAYFFILCYGLSQTGSMLSFVCSRSDCQLTI